MSNLTAVAKVNLTYTGPDNETVTAPAVSVSAAYMAQGINTVDVPAAATGAFAIPFGSVGVGATCIVIENKTAQDISLALGTFSLASGGTVMIAQGALPASGKLTAATATLSGAQVAAGSIVAKVFGDPV